MKTKYLVRLYDNKQPILGTDSARIYRAGAIQDSIDHFRKVLNVLPEKRKRATHIVVTYLRDNNDEELWREQL